MDMGNAKLAVNIVARGSAGYIREDPSGIVETKLETGSASTVCRVSGCGKTTKCKEESVQSDRESCDQRDNSGGKPRACHDHRLGKKYAGVHPASGDSPVAPTVLAGDGDIRLTPITASRRWTCSAF